MRFLTLAFLVLVVLYFGFAPNRVNVDDLELRVIYIQAIDSATNKPINVSVKHVGGKLHSLRGSSGTPVSIELNGKGLVRATWLDLVESDATIELSADGYMPHQVPLDQISIISKGSVSAAMDTPDTVELSKLD